MSVKTTFAVMLKYRSIFLATICFLVGLESVINVYIWEIAENYSDFCIDISLDLLNILV